MNSIQSQNFTVVLRDASRFAKQWRLLLLWLAVLLIPTALMTFPIWHVFANLLDHSVHAPELAQRLDSNSVGDLISAINVNAIAVHGSGIASIIVTLLLSPFLSGVVITAAKAPVQLSFGQLIHGGITEYGRLLRLLIWAIVPLGIAGGIGSGAMYLAGKFAEKAILESNADLANNAALALSVILFFVADAAVDAGRAQFALSSKRRSAIKALWQGVKLVCTRPLTSLGLYLLLTVIGFAVAGLLSVLRINLPQASVAGFAIALLLAQLTVAAIAWLRGARLFALIQLAKPSESTAS
jgi:hypothetical protein